MSDFSLSACGARRSSSGRYGSKQHVAHLAKYPIWLMGVENSRTISANFLPAPDDPPLAELSSGLDVADGLRQSSE
ncbi:MAG: hypothetical protein IPL01_08710 [Acidobacteria bacterium]|nr:hypothetical protein [Acidobacteriota bacterium]